MTSRAVQSLSAFETERRSTERGRTDIIATLRQQRKSNETVQLTNITPQGCGFKSSCHIAVGTPVWLGLPGLETWSATVSWLEDGKGGLSFDRALHPMVAARYLNGYTGGRPNKDTTDRTPVEPAADLEAQAKAMGMSQPDTECIGPNGLPSGPATARFPLGHMP